MEPLTIKTPADVVNFIGHTLGFWPHEGLVCITMGANRVGATLRIDQSTQATAPPWPTPRKKPKPRTPFMTEWNQFSG
jgi:hypothetical protein